MRIRPFWRGTVAQLLKCASKQKRHVNNYDLQSTVFVFSHTYYYCISGHLLSGISHPSYAGNTVSVFFFGVGGGVSCHKDAWSYHDMLLLRNKDLSSVCNFEGHKSDNKIRSISVKSDQTSTKIKERSHISGGNHSKFLLTDKAVRSADDHATTRPFFGPLQPVAERLARDAVTGRRHTFPRRLRLDRLNGRLLGWRQIEVDDGDARRPVSGLVGARGVHQLERQEEEEDGGHDEQGQTQPQRVPAVDQVAAQLVEQKSKFLVRFPAVSNLHRHHQHQHHYHHHHHQQHQHQQKQQQQQ